MALIKPRNTTGRNQYTNGTAQKSKGDSIALRLPLDLDKFIRTQAETQGKKPSEVIEQAVQLMMLARNSPS